MDNLGCKISSFWIYFGWPIMNPYVYSEQLVETWEFRQEWVRFADNFRHNFALMKKRQYFQKKISFSNACFVLVDAMWRCKNVAFVNKRATTCMSQRQRRTDQANAHHPRPTWNFSFFSKENFIGSKGFSKNQNKVSDSFQQRQYIFRAWFCFDISFSNRIQVYNY